MTASPTALSPNNTAPRVAPNLWRRMACWLYEGMLLFGVVFITGYLFGTLTQTRNALNNRHGLQIFCFVVIENNDLKPRLNRCRHHIMRSGAAVSQDTNICPLATQLGQRHDIRAITFFQTVRYIKTRINTAMAQETHKDSRRGRTIDIEVTKDSDFLAIHDGLRHIIGQGGHAL